MARTARVTKRPATATRTRKATKHTKAPKDIVNVEGALAIVERLDTEFQDDGRAGNPDVSVYRRLYREALEQEERRITGGGRGPDAPALLALITSADAFVEPVEAIRRSGFVQGYEFLRSLLLTGGAR